MGPSKEPSVNVTGSFLSPRARACGLEGVVREALVEQGVAQGEKLECFLNSTPCVLKLRGVPPTREAVLSFSGDQRVIVRLSLNTLSGAQQMLVDELLSGKRQDERGQPAEHDLTLQLKRPLDLLSSHERITVVIAQCIAGTRASELKPSLPIDGFGPAEHQLLARGLLAERYAAAGRKSEAQALYQELLEDGCERLERIAKEGLSRERSIKVLGELYGYLLSGAVRGGNGDLVAQCTKAIAATLPELNENIERAAFLFFGDDALSEMVSARRTPAALGIISELPLEAQGQTMITLFYSLDSGVSPSSFTLLAEFVEQLELQLQIESIDREDNEDLIEKLRNACVVTGLRLGYRNPEDLGADPHLDLFNGTVAGVLAGAHLLRGSAADAKSVFDEFCRRESGEDRERESREFIEGILKVTPLGYSLAEEALFDLTKPATIVEDSFKIICAAFEAGAAKWSEERLDRWLSELPSPEPSDMSSSKTGSFSWALKEGLLCLGRQSDNFEHRGPLFTRLFDTFVPHFGESRGDLALMQRFFAFAGEYGLLETLSRLDRHRQCSPLKRFELCLATIKSRASEGSPELASKAVRAAQKLLIDSAEDGAHGRAVGFEPLLHDEDVFQGFVRQKARLLEAVLIANLSPASEEIADSLIGNAGMANPDLLPSLTYGVAVTLRRWELKKDQPSILK